MKKSNPLKYIYWPFLAMRSKALSKMLAKHILPGSSILDVGAGNMLVAQRLVDTKRITVQGLDVLDMNFTDLPHKLFNGMNIPFNNNTFDTALLIGVLHHVSDQEALLKEVKRVTRSNIIIFEDTYNTELGKLWVKIRDVIGNIPEELKMNFALNFRKVDEWKDLFTKLDLVLKYEKTFFNPTRLTYHTLFVIEQKNKL